MKALAQLLEESEDELLLQLGATSIALSSDPSLLGTGSLGVPADFERMLAEDDPGFLRTTGLKILRRTSRKLHAVVCEQGNAEAQKSMQSSLSDGKTALAAGLVALLAQIGITSPVALIVAAVLAKKLFEATHEVLCEEWHAFNQSIDA